jgi:hypothetical protein
MTRERANMKRLNAAFLTMVLLTGTSVTPLTLSGCESLPGDRESQGAVIGGASGAVLGAVIAKENRLIGALIGGALGAGAGWLIGAKTDWFEGDDDDAEREARQAVEKSERDPASAEDARNARTADINDDGFVTLDEVIALEDADFTDAQIIDRLEATNQVFDLNTSQEQVLRNGGVSNAVIRALRTINQKERDRVLATKNDDVISRDPDDDDDM